MCNSDVDIDRYWYLLANWDSYKQKTNGYKRIYQQRLQTDDLTRSYEQPKYIS